MLPQPNMIMKRFSAAAVFLALSSFSHAATLWADDYSTSRTGTSHPNPYDYTGANGNDYTINTGGATYTVGSGVLNVADGSTTGTPSLQINANQFTTTTFTAGDTITVSMDIRVNSLLASTGGNSVPRLVIRSAGAEVLTVGYGYAIFTGQSSATMGFYKGGLSSEGVDTGNGINIGGQGFDFGTYNTTIATENGTNNTWYRIYVTMTQGQQAYTGTITNLASNDVANFSGNLTSALAWVNDTTAGLRIYAGLGGTSNYDLDNLLVTHTPVPEPASALLGGLGMLALLRRRRA